MLGTLNHLDEAKRVEGAALARRLRQGCTCGGRAVLVNASVKGRQATRSLSPLPAGVCMLWLTTTFRPFPAYRIGLDSFGEVRRG